MSSLHQNHYENMEVKKEEWLDQNIFDWCLLHCGFDFLKMGDNVNRCASVNVTSKFVSNLVISSHEPSVVVDQTICIHPLMNAPFSPFATKLTIAKTLEFDLTDIAPDESLWKTTGGERTCCDSIVLSER